MSGVPAPAAPLTAASLPPVISLTAIASGPVEQLPDRLEPLTRTIVVNGTTASSSADGSTHVRTAAGDVALSLPDPLPADRPVTVQIQPGEPPRATVYANVPTASTAFTQATPGNRVETPVSSTLASPPTSTSSAAAAGPALTPGTVLPALVLSAAPRGTAGATPPETPRAQAVSAPETENASPPGAATDEAIAADPPASPQTADMTGMGDPAKTETKGQFAATDARRGTVAPDPDEPPETKAMAEPETPPAAEDGASPAKEPPALRPGMMVALRVVSVDRPADNADGRVPRAAKTGDAAKAETEVRGTIAGSGPRGEPILATADGNFVLDTRADLPAGTRIVAERVALPDVAPSRTVEAADLLDLATTGDSWPELRRLLAQLAGVDRNAADQLLRSVLPQPNAKLGAALTFLMTALRGGDGLAWLGADAAGALKHGGLSDAIERFQTEFRKSAEASTENASETWTNFIVPILDGTGVRSMRLSVENADPDGADRNGGQREPRNRFLIDVTFSRLGPIQLDGLVRARRFDLILRSLSPLPPPLRHELADTFANTVAAVGYTGTLSCQAGLRNWVSTPPTRPSEQGLTL